MESALEAYRGCADSLQRLQNVLDNEDAVNSVLEEATNHLKAMRNSCAHGTAVQDGIAQLPDLTRIFDFILFEDDIKRFSYLPSFPPLQRMCWQTMANLCVQNVTTQSMIWSHFGHKVIEATRHSSSYTNIQIMILFNIFQSGNIQSYDKTIFEVLITKLSENPNDTCEFSEIFLEYFLTSYHRVVFLYGTLADQDRIMVLYYIAEYVRNSTPERRVNHSLLTYISKELKKKSDCILRTHNASDVEHLRPREVLALLDVIALASGMEIYSEIYCNDHSLFLNVGGLLQQLKAIGESSQNIFTPMKKLEQVAPNSKISSDFETEISFRLKTTLVRILANLSYKNRKNQEYARETGIIMAILDCTSADGRNPLIKEWSILAIRNLCEKCPENQELIANLSKVGDAENELLKELNLELGSLRI